MTTDAPQADGNPDGIERRLATILSCDVAGYSRMMGEDEERTIQTFRSHRAVFDALLKQHRGRIFNTAGDSVLAEFPSAVEAVRCATEIQSALQTRNEHLPANQQMLFRMGINVGDVIVQNGDLLGDGVNVAARIQTAAEPGGVCISGSVYDQIQNKLSLQFRSLGDQHYKNIGKAVRTFTITHGESGSLPAPQGRTLARIALPILAGAGVLFAVAGGGYWIYHWNESHTAEEKSLAAQLAVEKRTAEDSRRLAEEQSKRVAEAGAKDGQSAGTAAPGATRAGAATSGTGTSGAGTSGATASGATSSGAAPSTAHKAAPQANQQVAAQAPRSPISDQAQQATVAGSPKAQKQASAVVGAKSAAPLPTASGKRFDGTYSGQLCNFPANAARRFCWTVSLTVQNNIITGSWPGHRIDRPAFIRATIEPPGSVVAKIEGWNAKAGGAPANASLTGNVDDNHIVIRGNWANGAPIGGYWTKTP